MISKLNPRIGWRLDSPLWRLITQNMSNLVKFRHFIHFLNKYIDKTAKKTYYYSQNE